MALTRPTEIVKPFAASGSKNVIPVPTQVGITLGAASFETGFPPATMTDISLGGIAPDGMDMNGVLYSLSENIRFTNAGGQAAFDADLATELGGYPIGVILQDNAGVNSYINILANNTTNFNTTPASIGVSWIFYNSIYSTVPTGACMHFPTIAPPSGWLKLNGITISRVTYAKLWTFAQASGNIVADGSWQAGMFSTGDGSTTFRIPDLRGEFVRGFDESRGVDAGRTIGSWQKGTLVTWDDYTGTWGVSSNTTTADIATTQVAVGADAYTTSDYATMSLEGLASTTSLALPGNAGGAWTGTTRPRNIALLACIKY